MKKLLLVISLFFSIAVAHSFLSAETKLIKSARKSMDYMSYNQAARFLKQALLKKPSQKDVRIHLAFTYSRMGKDEEAIPALKEELFLFPDSLNAFILLGYIYFKQGHYDKAASTCHDFEAVVEKAAKAEAKKEGLDLFKKSHLAIFSRKHQYFIGKVRTKNSNFSLPYFILGLSYKKSGNFREAANNFKYALEWGYDPVDCHTQLIDVELIKENWKGALSKSQEALEAEGSLAEFNFLMGFSYHHLEEIENAVRCFKKSIELKPFLSESLGNLAKIYIAQGEFKNAIPLLRKVLKMGAFDQETYSLLRQATGAEPKKIEKASPQLSKDFIDELELEYKYDFVADVNDVAFGINASALDLIKAGRINAAGNLMKNFLEIHDLSPELNYNLAKLYETNNSLGKALQYAWRAKELKEDYKDAYDLVAGIFFKLEDFEESVKFYEKVIEFDPKDAMSHFNLGCVYFARKDYEKAEEHWRKAINNEQKIKQAEEKDKPSQGELSLDITVKVWPISFEAHKSLGHLYLRKNLKEKALDEFIKAIELEPEDPASYFEVGKIYFELKDQKKATFYFEKYIYLGGNEEKVKEIIKSSSNGGLFPPLEATSPNKDDRKRLSGLKSLQSQHLSNLTPLKCRKF
jgi:tetratricopeptide (TPR) repeat protein